MGNSNPSRRRDRAGVRTPRLEHLMREELNFLFGAEIGDPCLSSLQVERVHLASNAAVATVYVRIATPPNAGTPASPPTVVSSQLAPEVHQALSRAAAFLRRRLTDVLPMKRSPELRFKPGVSPWADLLPEDFT